MKNINEEIAKEAMDYALIHIRMGCTQVTNNNLGDIYRASLNKGITDLRAGSRYLKETMKLIPALNRSFDISMMEFFSTIEMCKKYSLGNCYELAFMALDYMMNLPTEINAEIFNIKGGDHVFLVIGRAEGSDPKDPMTWGKNAYFCDPWAQKVFAASNYLTELKNFQRINNMNQMEDFNPHKHTLKQLRKINAKNIKAAVVEYNKKLDSTLKFAIDILKKDLLDILETLDSKYGDNDKKHIIVKQLIKKLELFDRSDPIFNYNFEATVKENRAKNIEIIKEINTFMQLSRNTRISLGRHRLFESSPMINSILQWFSQLISFFPESKQKVDLVLKKFQDNLDGMIKDNLITPQTNGSPAFN